MSLSSIDIIIVLAYVIVVLYLGFIVARKQEKGSNEAEDFILAGRKLTLPLFIASLVATWYGGILGIGEFVYKSGIVAWLCFCLPYYIAAALFAAFISKRIRNTTAHTIPEQISNSYGKTASRISSVIILVITIPAAYILMLGVLIQLFFDISLWLAIIIGAIVSLAYLFTGGFKADILTNAAQFVLMYIGFGVLIIFCFITFGFYDSIIPRLPETHLEITGAFSWQYILVWFVIAMQTFVDPSFHQRCAAAKTPKAAQRGIFISILFWALFDFMTITAGLYAKSAMDIDNPLMAYPLLGDMLLPPFWKGIFITSLLATVMSTLDSYAFLSGATIGNDLLNPVLNRKKKKYGIKKLTQIGLIITSLFGVLLAIAVPSAVELIYITASIGVPGLIIPLVVSYFPNIRLKSNSAIIIMLISSSIAFIWLILNKWGIGGVEFIEPMFAGIIVSIIISVFTIKIN